MLLKQRMICGFVFSLMFAGAPTVWGGALAPCIKATSSANGNFLVISDFEWQPVAHSIARQAKQVTLQVIPKEKFINEKDRLDSQGTFWDDWTQWSVDLDKQSSPFSLGCPLSLITDDGEFLVVVGGCFDYCLRIYERRDHLGDPVRQGPDRGVFVKNISLSGLWPADRVAANQAMDDESPQWFAGGTFEFSEDCRELIHKTRWGNVVRIRLADGSISKN
jgi:hypothetical protein